MTSRIRYIRPDFFTDEDIASLPVKIRLFYIGLWTHADKAGRLQDRPKKLNVEIMPFDKRFNADEALSILAQPKVTSGRPFVIRYQIGDEAYIQIVKWNAHQKPHPTEKESEIPAPPNNIYLNVKKRLQKDGDGDRDGDGDGKEERDRGKGEPIDPPAPIQGSGSAKDAEPSLTKIENFSTRKDKEVSAPVGSASGITFVAPPTRRGRVPGFNDGELGLVAEIVEKSGPAAAVAYLEKSKRQILPCLRPILEADERV